MRFPPQLAERQIQRPSLEDDVICHVPHDSHSVLPWREREVEVPQCVRQDDPQDHQRKASAHAVPGPCSSVARQVRKLPKRQKKKTPLLLCRGVLSPSNKFTQSRHLPMRNGWYALLSMISPGRVVHLSAMNSFGSAKYRASGPPLLRQPLISLCLLNGRTENNKVSSLLHLVCDAKK